MSIMNLAHGKDLANCDQDQNSHQRCSIPAESPIVPPSPTRLLKSTDPLCEFCAIVHSKRTSLVCKKKVGGSRKESKNRGTTLYHTWKFTSMKLSF